MIDWNTWIGLGIAVLIVLATVLLLGAITALVMRLIARRHPGIYEALAPVRRRFRVLLLVAGVWLAVVFVLPEGTVRDIAGQVLLIGVLAAAGWLLGALLNLALDRTLNYYPTDVADNNVARRVRTQVLVLRRLGHAIIAVITIGAILLTFPGAQTLGASVLASAGLVSVVAGIAAQSALANVFAGMQLAFSDAIRVDDVVVAAGEWGRIEEITLTYVVVTTWDQRRLVLPSTYFTSTPFENWTRSGSALFGAVEFDLDWRVSTSGLRAELAKILDATELWDRRSSNVQVTDATGGMVRVRVMVSAANAGALWDLRCLVREKIVDWAQSKSATSLPRTRVLMLDNDRPTRSRPKDDANDGLFSGSPEADERGQQFKDTPAGERP